MKFPSVLKVEINNISYLKSFLKKERKTTSVALVGPGAGSNSKKMKFTEEVLKQIKYHLEQQQHLQDIYIHQ